MGQKVNPTSLRLGKTNLNFDFCWFNDSNYVNLLMRDFKIQSYINLILKQIKFSSAKYSIQNLPTKIKISVFFLNPNKTKTHVSKVFFLKNYKKIRKSKRNLLSSFSLLTKNSISSFARQSKTKNNFYFLQKNKNYEKATSTSYEQVKKQRILQYLLNNLHFNGIDSNKNFFFNHYFKLFAYINKTNQIYLKYFLIKYFSHKLITLPKLSANLFKNKHLPKFNCYNNMLYLNNTNFLFFKSHKNKFFLALLNLQTQVSNYETMFMSDCFEKKHIFSLALQGKGNKNKFANENKNKLVNTEKNEKKIPYSMSILIVQLQILDYVKKTNKNLSQYKLKSTKFLNILHLLLQKNTDFNLLNFFTNKKVPSITSDNSTSYFHKHTLAETNFLTLQNEKRKNQVFSNQKINEIDDKLERKITHAFTFNDKLNYFFNENKRKYQGVSKLNNQVYNSTYNKYCDLSKYSVCNDFFFSNTKSAGNFFSKKNTYLNLITPPHKLHIQSHVSNVFLCNTNFQFFQTYNLFSSANFLIDEIIHYIEKKVPFFRIKNYILRKLTEEKSLHVKGLRVMCSGRVGGKSKKAQRSKIQHFKYGETSLHVFSSKIDFKSKNAFTTFGTLGIKVWICYY